MNVNCSAGSDAFFYTLQSYSLHLPKLLPDKEYLLRFVKKHLQPTKQIANKVLCTCNSLQRSQPSQR
jgi:hypothetical protein